MSDHYLELTEAQVNIKAEDGRVCVTVEQADNIAMQLMLSARELEAQ